MAFILSQSAKKDLARDILMKEIAEAMLLYYSRRSM